MKALPIIAVSTALVSIPAVAQPTADELVGKHQVGVFSNYIKGNDVRIPSELDDGWTLGFQWGYRFAEMFGARIFGERLDLERKDNSDLVGSNAGADMLFYPLPTTYMSLGARRIDQNKGRGAVNLGLGQHWFFTEDWSASAEANLIQSFDNSYTSWEAGLGLNYFFGGASEPAKPVDMDGDGVTDDVDKCPNTPAGYGVDIDGCALDDDMDTVANTIDKCPDTAKGATVDAMGCELDDDKDTVVNSMDKCANTPITDKVDATGCSIFTEEQVAIRLDINFANNSAVVPKTAYPQIAEVAEFMKQYSNTDVVIEGHSSASGPAAFNKKLSQKRADAVAKLLVSEYGIAKSRVASKGYGEERLLDLSGTAAAEKINRRVEANIKATKLIKEQR